jgi:hypothetical protein
MTQISIPSIEILKDLLCLTIENQFFDLHNDFDCTEINHTSATNSLSFTFVSNNSKTKLNISFFDIKLIEFQFKSIGIRQSLTLDLFYRGRFEKDNHLFDVDEFGLGYMYVEFYEEVRFEFFSSSFIVEVEQNFTAP